MELLVARDILQKLEMWSRGIEVFEKDRGDASRDRIGSLNEMAGKRQREE
jgi:hypothetical protein